LSPDWESENGGPKCNDVCAHRVERGVVGLKKGRDMKEVVAPEGMKHRDGLRVYWQYICAESALEVAFMQQGITYDSV
jgi:hypothetical protein